MSGPFITTLGFCGILPRMRAPFVPFALLAAAFLGALVATLLLAQRPEDLPASAAPAVPAPAGDATLSPRDHERVRAAVARGEMVPLEGVLADAQRRHAGTVLEVELESGGRYEVEILGGDGVIRELEYDARTGELLEVEVEEN